MFILSQTGDGRRTGLLTLGGKVVTTPAVVVGAPSWTLEGATPAELAALGVAGICIDPGLIQTRPAPVAHPTVLPSLLVLAGWPLTEAVAAGARLLRYDRSQITYASRHDGSRYTIGPEQTGSVARSLGADIAIAPALPPILSLASGKNAAIAQADRDRWQREALESAGGTPVLARLAGGDEALFNEPFLGAVSDNPELLANAPDQWLRVWEATTRQALLAARPPAADFVLADVRALGTTALTPDGALDLASPGYSLESAPLDPACDCPACRHSTGYLHHLLSVGEVLGPLLLTLHNIRTLVRRVAVAAN